jgi:hypothetical protein
VSFRDYLSNDKKAALANLEICRKISDEFEEFLAIFTTAAQSGKLVIDKKMEEQLIIALGWAPLTIMLITETTERASKSVGFAMDIESSKILKIIKKSSSKLGISRNTFEDALKQIYPVFRVESFENARVALHYWKEVINQVSKLKITDSNIDKKWKVFFKSIDFTQ